MEILIKIYCDDKIINKINENGELFFEDGSRVKRKTCKDIKILCDSCNSYSTWGSIPAKEFLLKNEFLCRSCRQIGEKNSQFGKEWTDEKKLLRSIEMSGEKNPMYGKSFYDIWLEKHGEKEANILLEKHKLKSKKIAEENGMFGKRFYDIWVEKYGEDEAKNRLSKFRINKSNWIKNNPEHHNKMIINSHIKKYRKTSIERIVESYLKENKINYKYNFILDNKYQFDFYLEGFNLIIETHGDYWHANPLYYSDIDKSKKKLNETQKYKNELDKIKHDYTTNKGYKLICLWETDIKNENYKKILKDYGVY